MKMWEKRKLRSKYYMIENQEDPDSTRAKRIKELTDSVNSLILRSRGDWIRTSDHTPPPDVYSKTEYSIYFQRIILLPNVAVDFSVDLTVKG